MYDKKGPIDQLVHLYVDGGITRRDLVRRVARKTGGIAAAMSVLAGYEDLKAQPTPVPANVRVPGDAEGGSERLPAGSARGPREPRPGGAHQGRHPPHRACRFHRALR